MTAPKENLEYAGFWIRSFASLLDTLILMALTFPLLTLIYGEAFWGENPSYGFWYYMLTYVLPSIAVTAFWVYKMATPGKMAIRCKIVDARTGGKPSVSQCVVRYLGYYVSTIPLGLGFVWIAFDPKKQGWHDKLARTTVVRNTGKVEVVFE